MMEELATLKAKRVKVDASVLKDLLASQAETINTIKKHQDQRFNENVSKIEELISTFTAMKETLREEIQTLKHTTDELSKHNVHLEELETEKTKVSKDITQLEEKRKNLRSTKPNVQDQQILEQGKRKLRLYKDLTRIHWDYQAIQHSIKGYVSNKCDYIHHFCYENQEFNEKLIDSLWHEIYLSTNKISQVHDENAQSNVSILSNVDFMSK